jgi:hypothetical protein
MARETVVRVTCDACGKEIVDDICHSLRIGDRKVDLCNDCYPKDLLEKLEDKGEVAEPQVAPIIFPIVPSIPSVPSLPAPWHPNTNPIWIGDPPTPWPPYQPYVGDPPYDPRPTIICGTTTVHSQTTCCIR